MIKVLAFDLDDTLWDMRPTLLRAENELHLWLEEHCPRLNFDMISMGKVRTEVVAAEPDLVNRISELRKRVIARSLVLSGYAQAEANDLSQQAFEVFLEARNQVFFFDDAVATVAELSEHYTLGTLTNGNSDIDRLGLGDYFSFSFTAEQVGNPKPAPDLFLQALRHTGVEPHEMVYVGDHPEKDIAAAHSTGLYTIWVNIMSRDYKGKVAPDEEVTFLKDLPSAVSRIAELS